MKYFITCIVFTVFSISATNSFAANCNGDVLIKKFALMGFKKITISTTLGANPEREKTHGFREYFLDNQDYLLGQIPGPEKVSDELRKKLFSEAEKKIISLVIVEFDTEELAKKAIGNQATEYQGYAANYVLATLRKSVKIKPVAELLRICDQPLHQIFRLDASYSGLRIPEDWDIYKKKQPKISAVIKKRQELKAKKDTPLISLIKGQKLDEVMQLVQQKKTDLNQFDNDYNKRSPLHWVLLSNNVSFIDQLAPILVDQGINCNTQDRYGVTPFMLAAQHSLEMTKLLYSCGVDLDKKTNEGETALDFAKNAQLDDVVTYLSQLNIAQ